MSAAMATGAAPGFLAQGRDALRRAAEKLSGLTAETLQTEDANAVWHDIKLGCHAAHRAHARRGGLVLNAFCLCGHRNMGNGDGDRCGRLGDLTEEHESAEAWIEAARSLCADTLAALAAVTTPSEETEGAR